MGRTQPDEGELRRALLYWWVPGVTAAAVCAVRISREALRRARRRLDATLRLTAEDLVQMALVQAPQPLTARELTATIEWLDRATGSKEELDAVLARRTADGRVRRVGDGWELSAEWP